jgi:hypothetical protein
MFYFKTPLIMDKVLSPLIVKSEAALPVARHELEAEEQRFNTADGVEDSKFLPVTPTPSVEGATSATPPATPSSYMGLPNGDAVVANGMPPKVNFFLR